MPRVTAEHQIARRNQIAQATARVFERSGVSGASMTEIIRESGVSAGGIYGNFKDKADLIMYLAETAFGWQLDVLDLEKNSSEPRSPLEVLRSALSAVSVESTAAVVLLQLWAETTTNEDLRELLAAGTAEFRVQLERAITPWSEAASPDGIGALASQVVTVIISLCQAFIVANALGSVITVDEYLTTTSQVFRA